MNRLVIITFVLYASPGSETDLSVSLESRLCDRLCHLVLT